jgi:hypothetical protein
MAFFPKTFCSASKGDATATGSWCKEVTARRNMNIARGVSSAGTEAVSVGVNVMLATRETTVDLLTHARRVD